MTFNVWQHCAISTLEISKKHFAKFDYFVKMKQSEGSNTFEFTRTWLLSCSSMDSFLAALIGIKKYFHNLLQKNIESKQRGTPTTCKKVMDNFEGSVHFFSVPRFTQRIWNICRLESVQDFLIILDMKPCMHLVEISIFH